MYFARGKEVGCWVDKKGGITVSYARSLGLGADNSRKKFALIVTPAKNRFATPEEDTGRALLLPALEAVFRER